MQKISPMAAKRKEDSRLGDPCTACDDSPRPPPRTLRYDDLSPEQKNRFWKKRVTSQISKLEDKNRAKKEAINNKIANDQQRKEGQRKRLKEIQMIRAKQAAYIKQRMEEDLAEEERQRQEEARARRAAKYHEQEVQCPSPAPHMDCEQDGATNITYVAPAKELSTVEVQTEHVEILDHEDQEERDRGNREAGVQKVTPLLIYRVGTNVSPPISFRANNKSPQATPRDLGPAGVCSERLGTLLSVYVDDLRTQNFYERD